MDLLSDEHQEAAHSASSSIVRQQSASTSTNQQTESRNLRSSTRAKPANRKIKGKLPEDQDQTPLVTTQVPESSSRSTRSSQRTKRSADTALAKGKGKEVDQPRASKRSRKPTNPPAAPLTISEPQRDLKGKKRAVPEPSSEDEDTAGPSSKRPRTGYSLRSKSSTTNLTVMPRKARPTVTKGKAAMKTKAMAMAGSSRIADDEDDVEMLDPEYRQDSDPVVEGDAEKGHDEDDHDDDNHGHELDEDEDDDDRDDGDGIVPANEDGSSSRPPDEASALSVFGDFRQFGSYMMSLSSRLKTMLTNIKPTADPTTRMITLQELSELLSISTEDTLAGSFPVEQFVRELVRILGGQGADEDEDRDGDEEPQDEDAALAAALAMSAGGAYQGDENLEAQVLACRCLANLMEALPGVAHTVVYHGAIPVLCSKLIEISYIDLAEQTLSTLEKISEEFPSSIVREGGLAALLNYLDFFSIAVQRTALQAACNCCRNISSDHFTQIHGVWPIIRNCLSYSDQRLVEFACLCVIRVIDSYHRSSIEHLETLVDKDLIQAVNSLLLPAGGSPLIAANTFTLLLRALATSARASPKIALTLLEADIVDTLYQILTGVLPSAGQRGNEQGDSAGGQGLGGGLADMTVMENLAHRPKEQIEEALSLVSELMPPIPKDGVFDHKSYTEKSLARMMKAKAKADRAAAKQVLQAPLVAAGLIVSAPSPAPSPAEPQEGTPAPSAPSESQPPEGDDASASTTPPKEPAPDRTELLRSKPEVTDRFMQLMVPILVDVYAASVITPVRVKTLTGLLKAVSFLDAEGLNKVLACVPVASFASSILSSKDHPSLVIGALQLVESFLIKVPESYKHTFRREGVLHEIETLVQRTLSTSKSKEKEKDKDKDKESSESSTPDPPPAPAQTSSAHTIPGFKKLSSLALDPDDAITLRARVIRFKYLAGDEQRDGDKHFDALRRIVERISVRDATEKDLQKALRELADLFTSSHTSVSSFELLQTGVVDGLLQYTTDEDRTTTTKRRREIFLDAFTGRKSKAHNNGQTPFTVIVKKLQESLTRMESFDVVTVSQGIDDSKRSSPSLLARQLRLRLVASEESDSPRNIHNIVVSIHAIATFQALHDYLRPRITSLLSNTSRLSGMLAALQAHGLAGAADMAASKPSSSAPADEPQPSSSVGRRRSQRLSAKKAGTSGQASNDAEGSISADAPAQEATISDGNRGNDAPSSISAQQAEPLPGDMMDSDFQADFSEDDVDAELFDEEGDNNGAEKTVNLSVAEDGSKVVAQTPEGTRVATPSIKEATPASLSRGGSSKASYAAALKAKPTDWHLEFSMDDQALPLDLTIYGAIHQHEMRKKTGALPPSLIWQGIYTVKFKKVTGPAPSTESRAEEIASKSRSVNPILSSMPEDAPHSKILRLLRVLHQINTLEVERSIPVNDQRTLSEAAFINNKLTAKLTRQLEEPMIVASSCLPDWALDLPQHFPFLFPFATRYNFLQSTSFGYARLILKWQSQQARNQDSSRRDEGIGFLGRLQRQKVRISRKHILESAVKVFELYGSSSSILEVEYFEEAGTGLGPTLEFYSLVSKEFARKDLKIWRDSDTSATGMYVQHPTGLYPAPLSAEDIASDGGHKRTHILRVIGQFVAKAMLDSRIIDLHFNKVFLKLALGEEVPLTIQTLKLVDSGLASSLAKLQNMVGKRQGSTDKLSRKLALLDSVNIEDLALDFTVPGYDIELMPGGREKAVTSDNVEEYIQAVLETIIGKGAQVQVKAFREGFSKVFPITDLQTFSADELVMLFGNSDEDWSVETLQEALKADHGFNSESRSIHDLIAVMSEFDAPTRRDYLQFITGSPKLPIGGFRGLNPPLTVVRKPHEAPFTADDYLPSVMTCVNYFKLPEYSSKAVLREKVRIAMKEGIGSFHLS